MASKGIKVGEICGPARLYNEFDKYANQVLSGDFLQKITNDEMAKKSRIKYKILKQLPTREEYNRMRDQRFRTTVDALICDAFSEIESLADEMRSWFDNLSEGLQSADRGQRVEQAADALESLSQPDMTELVDKIQAVFLPELKATSRTARATEAADMLRTASQKLTDWMDDLEENQESVTIDGVEYKFDLSDIESIRDDAEEAANELEGVEFPGMYD